MGEVADPQLVRPLGAELPVDPVQRTQRLGVRDRGANDHASLRWRIGGEAPPYQCDLGLPTSVGQFKPVAIQRRSVLWMAERWNIGARCDNVDRPLDHQSHSINYR